MQQANRVLIQVDRQCDRILGIERHAEVMTSMPISWRHRMRTSSNAALLAAALAVLVMALPGCTQHHEKPTTTPAHNATDPTVLPRPPASIVEPAKRPSEMAPPLPKVAVLSSDFGHYQTEFDAIMKKIGWSAEKIQNTDTGKLTQFLASGDLLVVSTVGNYSKTVDFAKDTVGLNAFLERGGAIITVDANYDSVLEKWVCGLRPEFAAKTEGCAPHTGMNGRSRKTTWDPDHPLLSTPVKLQPLLEEWPSIWRHLVADPSPEGWKNLTTCADGQSLLLMREVGKGLLVLSSFQDFYSINRHDAGAGLLLNTWRYVLGIRSRLVILGVEERGRTQEQCEFALRLGNREATARKLDVTYRLNDGEEESVACALNAGEHAQVLLRPRIKQRGQGQLLVTIEENEKVLHELVTSVVIPQPIALKLERERFSIGPDSKAVIGYDCAPEFLAAIGDPLAELASGDTVVLRFRPNAHGFASIETAALGEGKKTLILTLKDGKQDVARSEPVVLTIDPQLARVGVRADSTFTVDGKPFFPIGIYHLSVHGLPPENLDACLNEVSEAGFNLIHAAYIGKGYDYGAFLDRAAAKNVMVITEFIPPAAVRELAGKPAVFGWNLIDEPEWNGHTPAQVRARYNTMREADPTHPWYTVLVEPKTVGDYLNSADCFAHDDYIYHLDKEGALGKLFLGMKSFREKVHANPYGHSPFLAAVQMHRFPRMGLSLVTPPQFRNLTYQALAAGAKGIIDFAWNMPDDKDGYFKIHDYPELWAESKRIPREIKAIEAFLLEGELTNPDTGAQDVFAGHWKLKDGRQLLCVVNTTPKDAAVRLPIPAREIVPLPRTRAQVLTIEKTQLTGTLSGYEVAVVEMIAP